MSLSKSSSTLKNNEKNTCSSTILSRSKFPWMTQEGALIFRYIFKVAWSEIIQVEKGRLAQENHVLRYQYIIIAIISFLRLAADCIQWEIMNTVHKVFSYGFRDSSVIELWDLWMNWYNEFQENVIEIWYGVATGKFGVFWRALMDWHRKHVVFSEGS